MIRRFNYTGRRRILRKDICIWLEKDQNDFWFNAKLNLKNYELPSESLVFIEAYRQTMWMRFAAGTLGSIVLPTPRSLLEFESPEGILFRLRITSPDSKFKLLAEADGIPLGSKEENPENHICLLPIRSAALNNQIYRVDFTGPRPILLINSNVGHSDSIVRSPAFMTLALPSIFREVLTYIVFVEGGIEDGDDKEWCSNWKQFALGLPGVGEIPDQDGDHNLRIEWIDTAVSAFGKKQAVIGRFVEFWKEDVV